MTRFLRLFLPLLIIITFVFGNKIGWSGEEATANDNLSEYWNKEDGRFLICKNFVKYPAEEVCHIVFILNCPLITYELKNVLYRIPKRISTNHDRRIIPPLIEFLYKRDLTVEAGNDWKEVTIERVLEAINRLADKRDLPALMELMESNNLHPLHIDRHNPTLDPPISRLLRKVETIGGQSTLIQFKDFFLEIVFSEDNDKEYALKKLLIDIIIKLDKNIFNDDNTLKGIVKVIEQAPKISFWGIEIIKRVVGDHGKETLPFLSDILKSNADYETKCFVLDFICTIKGDEAISVLLDVARTHDNPYIRAYTVKSLGVLADRRAVLLLIDILRSEKSERVREATSDALGNFIKSGDLRAVQPLVESMMTDVSPRVRVICATSLSFVSDGSSVIPLIEAFQTDSSKDVRIEAAKSLGYIRDPRAIPPLTNALTECKDPEMEDAIRDALDKLKNSVD